MKHISIVFLAVAFSTSLYSMQEAVKEGEQQETFDSWDGKTWDFDRPKNGTPLCRAVVKGEVDKVQELFKNATPEDRKWSFKKAASTGQVAILQLLIAAGAEKTNDIFFALCDEIERTTPNMEVINCLFNTCKEDHKSGALATAVKKGNQGLVTHFLSLFPDDCQTIGWGFIHAYSGNPATLPLFLKNKHIGTLSKILAIATLAKKNDADSIALVLASGIEFTPSELSDENMFWRHAHAVRCSTLAEAIAHAKSHNNSNVVQALEPHFARETEAKNRFLDAKGR